MAADQGASYPDAVTKAPKKERLWLALIGAILTLGGLGFAAFMLVVGVITAFQGDTVDWGPLGIGIVLTGLIGLLGVWLVRRSGVPLGDALNF